MKYILILSLVLISQVLFAQQVLKGTATNVYDGDTFTLVESNGEKTKIRVVGIDAPEASQEYGLIARDYARSILDNKIVTVYCEPGDSYGRLLGTVITEDGLNFNYEMIINGYAWHYSYYNKDKFLSAAAAMAKASRLGLWENNLAVPPWEYRKNNK